MEKFWLATRVEDIRRILHYSKEAAMEEAKEMVRKGNTRAFILETTDYAEPGEIPVRWVSFGIGRVF